MKFRRAMAVAAAVTVIGMMGGTDCAEADFQNKSYFNQSSGNLADHTQQYLDQMEKLKEEKESSSAEEEETESQSADETDSSDSEVWLPDINTALCTEGQYYTTATAENGITYNFYSYDFEKEAEEVGTFIEIYTEALKELDFTAKRLNEDGAVWYETYSKEGYTAELGVYILDGGEEVVSGGTGSWRAILAVPEGMEFTLGSGAPGIRNGETVCVACKGSGHCEQCAGSGSANYGAGRVTCETCRGDGICTICDGKGTY